MKQLIIGIVFLISTQAAMAAGFALYEGSARGNALGGLTGQANDASAIFFNPAGMTQLEGTHFMGGSTLIAPWADLTMTDSYTGVTTDGEFKDQIFTPPHIYITHQINDQLWVGGGVYTRFGLGTKYEPDWNGRYSNIDTQIQTVSYGVEMAYKINENVSVGFGVSAMWFDAELTQAVDGERFQLNDTNNPATSQYDAVQTIAGDNISYGWDASVHYHNDRLGVGLFYVSSVEHDLEGTALWQRPDNIPAYWFQDANVTADTIELPEMIWFGLSYILNDKTSIGGGIVQTAWSSIESLVFHYDTPFVVVPALGAVDVAERELNWKDAMRYNVGVEYKYNDHLTLMGGLTYDETPLVDETVSYLLPTNNRTLLNMGLSLQRDKWLLTGSYNYLTMDDREFDDHQRSEGVLAGEASGGAHLLGFSVSRKF